MFGEHFEFNDNTLPIVEQIGFHMPGGFFIYKAEGDEELLYANRAVLDIFGCESLEEFKELTGYTFKGMLHPDDYIQISKSIKQQIDNNDDNLDYVEYRIIRKDGKIRWVDDYGHYTKTQAYGGIYYVFISDITDKKEQAESDKALRGAVIEALSRVYNSVWLINDIETESFTLFRVDEDEQGVHFNAAMSALKNMKFSDAFKFYAENMIIDEDREKFLNDVAIDNILKNTADKLIYSVIFRRQFETEIRYYRVEFARIELPGNKTGIVLGFKDANEEVNLEIHRKEQDKLITALASDYWSVYYLELDNDEGVCYQARPDIPHALCTGERFRFSDTFSLYAEKYITDEYRDEFLDFIKPDKIREGLKENRVISYRYMVRRNEIESYEMVRFAGVRHPEDRDDHLVHAVSACFSDVDVETRNSLSQNKTLSEALNAAEQANKAKTAFLSNMSHEIRTPMNAIIGLDNIALSDADLSDRTRDYLEKIGTSAHHLLSIINDILDMSRIESGRMVINIEEFSFSKVMNQVNTIIGGQCKNKGITYNSDIDDSIGEYFIGDDMKLRQVLINILGNAVKFTPSGGSVSLNVQAISKFDMNTTLRFIIADNGIGMSKEYIPRLFESFTQEDSSSTNTYGSTGLGMPITKNLVELMNGTIEVESEKNVGTTFTVTITFKDSGRKDSDDVDEIHPHEMVVLAIDDDPVACEHAKLVLGQVGISCDVATSGEQGIEMVKVRHARREPYNLILIDWKMPGMDGIETTKKIREVVGKESAIIILTSFNWDDVADEAKSAGVDTFVPKPLLASNVVDEFREAFKKKNSTSKRDINSLKGRRILLAEDVIINAEIMIMILTMNEITVDHAENGREAVEMFESHDAGYYDAILMDMRMPEMDGIEATKVIRNMNREDAEKIPIIALTANVFDEDVQRSMQAGLNAHLSKPVEPEALFETLRSFIV